MLGLFLAHQERCKEALTLLAEDSDRDASLARSRCKIRLGDLEGAHADSVATATDADDEWTRDQASWLASVAALKAGPTPDFPEETNPTNPMWSTLLEEELAI